MSPHRPIRPGRRHRLAPAAAAAAVLVIAAAGILLAFTGPRTHPRKSASEIDQESQLFDQSGPGAESPEWLSVPSVHKTTPAVRATDSAGWLHPLPPPASLDAGAEIGDLLIIPAPQDLPNPVLERSTPPGTESRKRPAPRDDHPAPTVANPGTVKDTPGTAKDAPIPNTVKDANPDAVKDISPGTAKDAPTPTPAPAPHPRTEPSGLPGPDPCATFDDFRRNACYQVLKSLGN